MQYFLVTHTSLVEAQDEQQAAQKSVDRLRAGGQLTVAVRSDETKITQVVVAAVAEGSAPVSPFEADDPSPAADRIPRTDTAAPKSRWLILKRMFTDGLAFFGRRT